ncbi:MAG: 50S ribosomal protein L20 [Planctomycetota bacterium]
MTRATNVPTRLKRRNKVLKAVKGYVAGRGKLFRIAKHANRRANQFAFRGRKERKRDFRRLWITRINGALWLKDINYSQFIHGLKLANIQLDRKMLSEMAIHDPSGFDLLVVKAQEFLKKAQEALKTAS